MLSERDGRSPRPEAPSSSLVLSRHSRHMPSITRTTEREACPAEQRRVLGEGRVLWRRGHAASVTRTRTPNRSHRSLIRSRSRCHWRSQFCRQQRAAPDVNCAARCGARSAAICAAQTQPFSDSQRIGKTGSRDEEDSHSATVCFLQRDTLGWQRKWHRTWLRQARPDGIRKGCVGRSATGCAAEYPSC